MLNLSFSWIVLVIIGVLVLSLSLQISSVIQSNKECALNDALVNSNRGVLVVGIILLGSGLTMYLLVKKNCVNESTDLNDDKTLLQIVVITLCLSIVLIILFSIMDSEMKKCGKSLGAYGYFLLSLSVLLLLSCLTFLGIHASRNKDSIKNSLENIQDMTNNSLQDVKQKTANTLNSFKNKLNDYNL